MQAHSIVVHHPAAALPDVHVSLHNRSPLPYVVVGGGAAGFFAAIACAEAAPHQSVILLEKGSQLLAKVRISGGGRCNVTHACFDPAKLMHYYPRGSKALRGPFTRFQPSDTIDWFASRGVTLKTEADGRMFPITDSSQTIIDCLMRAALDAKVDIRCQSGVEAVQQLEGGGFQLAIAGNRQLSAQSLLVATGSNRIVWQWLEALGHKIYPPVPSLFTFNVPTSPLKELSGISLENVHVSIEGSSLAQTGPLLLTHWGFSGPAVLKLSAWGARYLHDLDYRVIAIINWLPEESGDRLVARFASLRAQSPNRLIGGDAPVPLPRNLWRALLVRAGLDPAQRWANTNNQQIRHLATCLQVDRYQVEGKTTHKEEFVTCGGVDLDEVNTKTMESRLCPGLFFAGEVLDIDGVTGGFNFQSAWTTGYLSGRAMAGLPAK